MILMNFCVIDIAKHNLSVFLQISNNQEWDFIYYGFYENFKIQYEIDKERN